MFELLGVVGAFAVTWSVGFIGLRWFLRNLWP